MEIIVSVSSGNPNPTSAQRRGTADHGVQSGFLHQTRGAVSPDPGEDVKCS